MSVLIVKMYLDSRWNSFLLQGRNKMKFTRKLTVTLLTLALALGCVPCTTTEVQAAPKVPKTLTIYLTPGGDVEGRISIINIQKNQEITSIKMSSKGPLRSYYCTRLNDTSAYIGCRAQKAGITTVSFKIGDKQYKTKVYVKKYTNPLKSISITGLKDGNKTNLANLTNTTNITKKIELPGTVKNPKVQMIAKKGWKIKWISYTCGLKYANYTGGDEYGTKNFKTPVSKATVNICNKTKILKKNADGYGVFAELINSKNKASLYLTYYIDIDPKDILH